MGRFVRRGGVADDRHLELMDQAHRGRRTVATMSAAEAGSPETWREGHERLDAPWAGRAPA